MSPKKVINRTINRIFMVLLFSLASSHLYAFNGGGSDRMALPKHDLAMGNSRHTHITTMDELMGLQPSPNVNVNGIGIYVYNGMFSLDAMGPYQVFRSAGLKTFLVAKQKGPITMSNGLTITVDKSIDEVAKLDVLLVPGGADATALQTDLATNADVLDWIKND